MNKPVLNPSEINNLCSRKLWELLTTESSCAELLVDKNLLTCELLNRKHYLKELENWQKSNRDILH